MTNYCRSQSYQCVWIGIYSISKYLPESPTLHSTFNQVSERESTWLHVVIVIINFEMHIDCIYHRRCKMHRKKWLYLSGALQHAQKQWAHFGTPITSGTPSLAASYARTSFIFLFVQHVYVDITKAKHVFPSILYSHNQQWRRTPTPSQIRHSWKENCSYSSLCIHFPCPPSNLSNSQTPFVSDPWHMAHYSIPFL